MTMSARAKKATSSSFSSLPNDIVLNVLTRLPRKYHAILSCVSKKLQTIVCSPELHMTLSFLGKVDYFYVCFQDCDLSSLTHRWFALTEDHRLVSTQLPSPPEQYSAALMIGPEIYFVGGSLKRSRSMWILDSRSGKLRQGPSMLVATRSPAVGVLDDKIHIIGGCENEEIQAQVFDPKTQTWEIAVNPKVEVHSICMSVVNQSLNRKIYAKSADGETIIVYDPRDGNCKIIKLRRVDLYSYSKDVCVIDNVLYTHRSCFGLMWYDYMGKDWRKVYSLNFKKFNNRSNLSMAEYNGKLSLFWHEVAKKQIWCAMIALRPSELGVEGWVEWSSCILSNVPRNYNIMHCLARKD